MSPAPAGTPPWTKLGGGGGNALETQHISLAQSQGSVSSLNGGGCCSGEGGVLLAAPQFDSRNILRVLHVDEAGTVRPVGRLDSQHGPIEAISSLGLSTTGGACPVPPPPVPPHAQASLAWDGAETPASQPAVNASTSQYNFAQIGSAPGSAPSPQASGSAPFCVWAIRSASALRIVAGWWAHAPHANPHAAPLALRSSSSISLEELSQGSDSAASQQGGTGEGTPSYAGRRQALLLAEVACLSFGDLQMQCDVACILSLVVTCDMVCSAGGGDTPRCTRLDTQLLTAEGQGLRVTLERPNDSRCVLDWASGGVWAVCLRGRVFQQTGQRDTREAWDAALLGSLLPVRRLVAATLLELRGPAHVQCVYAAGRCLVWNGGGVREWPHGGVLWSTSDSLPGWAHTIAPPGGLTSSTALQHLAVHRAAEVLTCVVPLPVPSATTHTEHSLLLVCTTHRLVLLQVQRSPLAPPLAMLTTPLTPSMAAQCPFTLGTALQLPPSGWLLRTPTYAADGTLAVGGALLCSGGGHIVCVSLTRPITAAALAAREEATPPTAAADSSMVRFSESLSFSQDAPPLHPAGGGLGRVSGASSLGDSFALSMSPFSPTSQVTGASGRTTGLTGGSLEPPPSPPHFGHEDHAPPGRGHFPTSALDAAPSLAELDDILGDTEQPPAGDAGGGAECAVPLRVDLALSIMFRVPGADAGPLPPAERVVALLPMPQSAPQGAVQVLVYTSAGRCVGVQLSPPAADKAHPPCTPPQLQLDTSSTLSDPLPRRFWGGDEAELLQRAASVRFLVRGGAGSTREQSLLGGASALSRIMTRGTFFGGLSARKRWAGRVWATVGGGGEGGGSAAPQSAALPPNTPSRGRSRSKGRGTTPAQLAVPSSEELQQIPRVPIGSIAAPLATAAAGAWRQRVGWRQRAPSNTPAAALQAWTLHGLLGDAEEAHGAGLAAVAAASGMLPGTPRTGGSRQLFKRVDDFTFGVPGDVALESVAWLGAVARWMSETLKGIKGGAALADLAVPLLQMEHRPGSFDSDTWAGSLLLFRSLQICVFRAQFPAVFLRPHCTGSPNTAPLALLSARTPRPHEAGMWKQEQHLGRFFTPGVLRMLSQASSGLLFQHRAQLAPVLLPLLGAWEKLCSVFRFAMQRAVQGCSALAAAHRSRDVWLCVTVAGSRVHVAAAVASRLEPQGGEGGGGAFHEDAAESDLDSQHSFDQDLVVPEGGGEAPSTPPYRTRSIASSASHSEMSSRSVSASVISSVSMGASSPVGGGSMSAEGSAAPESEAASLGSPGLGENDSRAGDFEVGEGGSNGAGGGWSSVSDHEQFGGGWAGADEPGVGRPPPPMPSREAQPLDRWLALVPAPPALHRELGRGAPQSRQAVRRLGGVLRALRGVSAAAVSTLQTLEAEAEQCAASLQDSLARLNTREPQAGLQNVRADTESALDDTQVVLQMARHWRRCVEAVAPALVPLSACSEQLHIESACMAAAGARYSSAVWGAVKEGAGGVPTLDVVFTAASLVSLLGARTERTLYEATQLQQVSPSASASPILGGDEQAALPSQGGVRLCSEGGAGGVSEQGLARDNDSWMVQLASGAAFAHSSSVQGVFDFKSAWLAVPTAPRWWVQLSHAYGATDEVQPDATPAEVFAVIRNTAGAMNGDRLFRLVSSGAEALHPWSAACMRFEPRHAGSTGGSKTTSLWSTSEATTGVDATLALLQQKLGEGSGGHTEDPPPSTTVGGVKRRRAPSLAMGPEEGQDDDSDSLDALRGGSHSVASSTLGDWLPGACVVPCLAARLAVRASIALGTAISPAEVIRAAAPPSSGLGVLCTVQPSQNTPKLRTEGWHHLVFLGVRPAADPVPLWTDRLWDSGMGTGG